MSRQLSEQTARSDKEAAGRTKLDGSVPGVSWEKLFSSIETVINFKKDEE